jgi:uncharacterized membrane protein YgcG
MWCRGLLISVASVVALTACAIVDPVDNRYDTVSRSLAKARNEAIFLNLVRASHDYPLSFTTIANVTPSMQNTTSLALPSFLLGPRVPSATSPLFTPGRDVIFGNTTAGNSTQVSTNFNVSTQETSAFYEGFLKPIDLTTLNYFIRQGYSRELLFWLFTDSFELVTPQGLHIGYHYNPPEDYGCPRNDPRHRCFIDFVHNAAFTGLTVEEKTLQSSGSGGGGGGGGGGKPSGGGAAGAKPTTYSYQRFCFNKILGAEAQATVSREEAAATLSTLDVLPDLIFNSALACGDPSWNPSPDNQSAQPDILPLTLAPESSAVKFGITIVPRSAYGVFEFLGSIMKIRANKIGPLPSAYIPANRPSIAKPPILETIHEDPNLLVVTQNLGGECFVHTWFEDGDYCVPEDAATTKRVFGLLAQLIAIQTAASDLSITPIVRVIQ